MNKKVSILLLTVLSTLFIFSCNSVDKSNPKSVATAWLTAMYAMDWQAAQKISTKECVDLISVQSGFMAVYPQEEKDRYRKTKWEIIGEPVIEGNNATVTYKESSFPGEVKLPLIKVDDKWVVNLTKDSYQEEKDNMLPESGEGIPVGTDSINASSSSSAAPSTSEVPKKDDAKSYQD